MSKGLTQEEAREALRRAGFDVDKAIADLSEQEYGAPEAITLQQRFDKLFALIFDGIEIIANLNDRDEMGRLIKVAEAAFAILGAAENAGACQRQATMAGTAAVFVSGPIGQAVAYTGMGTACMASALYYSFNKIKKLTSVPKLFGDIFSLIYNFKRSISNKIGNIGRKYSIYQYSPLLLEPGATKEEIQNQKNVYYKKLLLLNSHLSFILDTNYYINTILEANNISFDIFNQLCNNKEVEQIINKIYLILWGGASSDNVAELVAFISNLELNLYNISPPILIFLLNLILFKNISQYIFFVVFGADMSSYSLQVALFKGIFEESSELQLSLYLYLVETGLNNNFSDVMNCIIQIYKYNQITYYLPIPAQMTKETEERLKNKQKKHMEDKLQDQEHEFTENDKYTVRLLMDKLIESGIQKWPIPIAGPSENIPDSPLNIDNNGQKKIDFDEPIGIRGAPEDIKPAQAQFQFNPGNLIAQATTLDALPVQGGSNGIKTITSIEINEAKPLNLTMRLQDPLKDFLKFPDLDKMDWNNNYDEELYKVANYIYNVISNEKNLETRTFMISTIYHNYLSELITTL